MTRSGMVHCRTGAVTTTELGTVPVLRRTASRYAAPGTRKLRGSDKIRSKIARRGLAKLAKATR